MGRLKQPIRASAGRRRWLAASSLALATAMLHPAPLLAQTATTTTPGMAVQGSATFNTGSATYNAGANTDVVRVQTTDLLINWVPFDTATAAVGGPDIKFLADGKSLFFISDGGNYTVVNRILPSDATRAIRFDGQVASFVNNGEAIGGNIFFYSPGGIIVGSTGRFDVGSLVLTTSDVTAAGTALSFPGSNPGSYVRIEPWAATGAGDATAQIDLLGAGSYLALVAPRVEQHGRVNVNGSIAYVAAESATLTVVNGLFNIVVGTGTGDRNGIVHSGITTGPSSTGDGDNQRTYLTAISKNDAITMLVTGQIGYAQASEAAIVNGSIQLLAQTQNPAGGGNIEVGATTFTSDVLLAASDTVSLTADGIGNDIVFGSATNRVDVDVFALKQIDLNATRGGNVSVFGDLTMYAGDFATGGIINVTVDDVGRNDDAIINGLIVVGDFSAAVNAVGSSAAGPGSVGDDAVGGTINVDVNTGGDVFFRSNVTFNASAQAGFGEERAGNATGGKVTIALTGVNSRFGMTNEFGVDARIDTSAKAAVNPFDGPSTAGQGGVATGGDVVLSLLDGRSAFGNLTIDTSAQASNGIDPSVVQDNAAYAGDVTIDFSGRTHDILGTLILNAFSGTGLSVDGAGNSVGGTTDRAIVDIGIDGADVTVGAVSIDASTEGNISAAAPANAIAFAATNNATFLTTSFAAIADHNNREFAAASRAGSIAITADGSSLDLGGTALSANNATFSGDLTRASNKRAGDVSLTASGGGSIAGGTLSIGAASRAGDVSAKGATAHVGGDVTLIADGSTIAFGRTTIDTSVDVPAGGDMTGLVSSGGNIVLRQLNADAGMTFDGLVLTSAAFAPFGAGDFVGDGGNAEAGDVTIEARSGAFATTSLSIDAGATGHEGGSLVATAGDAAGSGGSAQAGDVTLIAGGDSFSTGRLAIFAGANGGRGGAGVAESGATAAGDGGAAGGGTVTIQGLSGTLDIATFVPFLDVLAFGPSPVPLGALYIDASASGGAGGFGNGADGGKGGDATGGTAEFVIAGATTTFTTPTLALVANATGGAGGGTTAYYGGDNAPAGAGGNATGGTANYTLSGGSANLTSVILDASATGGRGGFRNGYYGATLAPGGVGGNALGGSTTATLGVADAGGVAYVLNSTAVGGAGGGGSYGLAGGIGRGGTALFTVGDAAIVVGSLTLDASGLGGAGGPANDAAGAGGDGGDGYGGTATIDVFGLAGALSSDTDIEITATGQGGLGQDGYSALGGEYSGSYAYGGPGGVGGAGSGGTINLTSRDGATFDLSTSGFIDARGIGGGGGGGGDSYYGAGAGGDGGDALGGAINLGATGGGTLTVSPVEGFTTLAASGVGGLGGDGGQSIFTDLVPSPGGNGAATGGTIGLLASGAGSDLTFLGDLTADASVVGAVDTRAGSTGADATGGSIDVDVADGGAFSVTGNLLLDAGALATVGAASLGNAAGGTVDLTMAGAASTFGVGNRLTIEVSAFEPIIGAVAPATGGDTIGGAVTLVFAGGTTTVSGGLTIDASAGSSTPRADETTLDVVSTASAVGGSVDLAFTGGSHTVGFTDIEIAAFAPGGQATAGTFDLLLDNASLTVFNGEGSEAMLVAIKAFGDTVIIPRDPAAQITMQNGAVFDAFTLRVVAESSSATIDSLIESGSISALFDDATVNSGLELSSIVSERSALFADNSASALTGDIDVTVRNGAALNQGLETSLVAAGMTGGDGSSAQTGDITISVDGATIQKGINALLQATAQGAVTAANPANVAESGDFAFTMSGTSQVSGNVLVEHNVLSGDSALGDGADALAGATTLNFLGGAFTAGAVTARSVVQAGSGGSGSVGGTGQGSNVRIAIDGASVDASGGIVAVTGAVAGRGGSGGNSGDVLGGDFTLEVVSGSLTTPFLDINTEARSGDATSGGTGVVGDAGDGGQAVGGDVAILNDGSGLLSLGGVTISTGAQGIYGGYSYQGYTGGDGGGAAGGNITISNQGTGSFAASSLAIDSSAQGGEGGDGTAGESFGGTGGAGGAGAAGSVTIATGATFAVQDLTVVADGVGGASGFGGGVVGGPGGAGTGGAIVLTAGSTLTGLATLSLSARGTGGVGVTNGGDFTQGGNGSDGGVGQGGSIVLELTGAGTTLPGGANISLDVSGTGGTGGAGGYGYTNGGDAGDGGAGTGGTLTLAGRSGATLDLTGFISTLSANGTGGGGGEGGYGGYGDGVSGAGGGAGGDGGLGTGGTLNLIGQGGAVVADDIELTATGTGGAAGAGGLGYYSATGAAGANGGGAGGLVTLQALEGSPGAITLGAVTIDASGLGGGGDLTVPTTGGSIAITDTSTDPAGLITLGSLTATALGMVAPADASFTMSGDSGPITVTGGVTVDVVGDIGFVFAGTGQLDAGGVTSLNAGGDITLAHTGNGASTVSIDTGGNFTAVAGGSFAGGAGSIVASGAALSITAQSIGYGSLVAGTNLTLNALNGSISGISDLLALGTIDLDATGAILIEDAEAGTGFTADAGTDVAFSAIVNSNNDLTISAGGDISGGSAVNDAPAGSGGFDRVILNAGGDLALTGAAQSLDDDVLLSAGGNIAAGTLAAGKNVQAIAGGLLAVGTVNLTNAGFTALLRGTSVALDDGTIAGNLTVDATDGSIAGTGTIAVGQAVDLDATGDIAFGSIAAGTGFTADAGGSIAFGDASTADNNLTFVAVGDIAGNSASNLAANGSGGDDSVSLTAGGDVSLTGASRAENNFTVRGVNVAIGAVNAAIGGSGAVDIQGTGAATVGGVTTGGSAGALIQGASVTLNNGSIGGQLRLNATAGDIDGTGTIAVGGAADFDATGNIAFGSIAAGTGFTADAGGSIAFVDASTADNNLTFVAGGDIAGGSANNLAANGSGGEDSVSLTADGDVTLTGTSRAENSFTVRGSNIAIAAINAATAGSGAIDVQATGAASVDSATTAGAASALIQGVSVTLGSAAIGGNLRLNALDGNLTTTGAVAVGGAADFDAAGDIVLASVATGTGIAADAGGDITFVDVSTADNNLSIVAGGAISGNSARNLAAAGSGGDDSVSLTAGGNVALTGLGRAENSFIVSGASIDLATINAALSGSGAIDVLGTGAVSVAVATTGGAAGALIEGAQVTLGTASIGGNLGLNATAGRIDLTGTIAVGGAADFDATGNIAFGSVAAGTGFTADAGGDILFTTATTGDNNLVFVAGGEISGDSASNLAANGSGSDDSVSLTAGGDLTLTGTNRAENIFTATSGGNLAIGAVNAATGGSGRFFIDAAGAASVGTATAAGAGSGFIEGASVSLTNLNVGGNLRLQAAAGNLTIDRAGTVFIGGVAEFVATGSIDFGSITGTGFTANAGGDLTFVDAASRDGNVFFIAGGDIIGNSASNLAANGSGGDDSVSLAAGGDITLTGTSRAENNFTVRAANVSIAAVNAATGASGALDIRTPGSAFVGNVTTGGATGALIEGAGVDLGGGAIGGNLQLNATAGSVTVDPAGTLTIGGAADFDATADIVFGSVTAGTGFTANAGNDILFTAAGTNDNNLVFVAGRDLIGVSAGNFAAVGSGGDDSVDLSAVRTVRLTGASQAENNFLVSAAEIDLGSVDAARGGSGAFSAIAVNLAAVDQLTTSGSAGATIEGANVTLGDATIGGNLRLNATAGDVTGTGTIAVGGAADFDATGNVVFGSITAGTGFTANAGGDIRFAFARTSDNNLVFVAGGDIAGTAASTIAPNGSGGDDSVSLTAGGDVTLTGASRAENSFTVRAANASIAAVNAATGGSGVLDVQVSGLADVGSATTGGSAAALIQGASVALDSGNIGGDLRLNATDGSIDGTGTIAVGGAADFDATGNIVFGSITAGTGFTANAGGELTFVDAATRDNNLVFVAGGDIAGNSASNLAADGSGGDDSVSLTAGGAVTLTGASRSENTFTVRGLNAAIGAVNAATGGSGALDIQVNGLADVGSATTGGTAIALIQGASVALDNGDIGGNLRLNATAGDIDGTGTIAVGGAADFDATGNIAFGSITAGTGFTANAGGDLTFVDAATQDNNLVFVAGGNIAGNSARNLAANGSGGNDTVSLAAGGNVTLTGTSRAENSFIVRAGNVTLGVLDGATGGAGTIDVQASGQVAIGTATTGGSAAALIQGAGVVLDNGNIGGNLRLNATGGDIAGAGAITVGGAADLDAIGTIAFGTLAAGGGFTADAGTDIVFGQASTADGNLVFVAGRDIVGTSASNLAASGSGGDDSVSLTAGRDATLSGASQAENDYTVTAGGAIAGGDFVAGGALTLDGGSIAIGEADAQAIDLISGDDILFDRLTSPNAISLTAANGTIGANSGAGDIDAGGDVTLRAEALAVGDVTSGGSVGATATRSDASFGAVEAAQAIAISAAGTPTLLSAISGGDTSITGRSVDFGNGNVGGTLTLDATAGDIDARGTVLVGGGIDFDAAGNVVFGSLDAGGAFTVDAGGAITFDRATSALSLAMTAGGAIAGGDLEAAGPLTLDGETIVIDAAVADSIAFTSRSDILFGTLTVGGPVSLTAASGTIGANTDAGDIEAEGDVSLTARALALGNVTTGGSVDAAATAGDAGFGTIDAAGDVTVSATGTPSIARVISGGDTTVSGSSVALTDGAIGGDLALTASEGNIDASGALTVGGAIALAASGDIAFGTLAAQGGDFTADAGGQIDFADASAAGALDFAAGGAIAGGDLAAGEGLALDGASVAVGNVAAEAIAIVSPGSVALGDATLGGGDLAVTAGDALVLGDATGAREIDLEAAGALAFGNLAGSGDASLTAQALSGGSVAAGGSLALQAAEMATASLEAGADIAFAAGADFLGGTLSAGGSIAGTAAGTLTAQSAVAGDALDLRAGSTLTIADAIGGTVALRSTGDAVIVTRDIDSTFSGDGQQAIVSGASVRIDDVNDLTLTLVQATDGDIDVVAAGDIGIVAAEAAGDIDLTSTGGDVRVTLAEAGKSGIIPASIAGAVGPAEIEVGDPGPSNITVSAAGLAQGRFVASGNITIGAGSDIDLAGADAGGSIGLDSGGSTRVFGTAAAGAHIAIQSDGDVRVTSSEASLEAGGDLTVEAGGMFDTQGFAYGASVSVTARDVVIGGSGQVGDGALTQSITFTGTGDTVFIGGEAEADAFSLDADEFGRIRGAGDLSIFARGVDQQEGAGLTTASHDGSSGGGDIVVRDLEVLAGSGGSLGTGGTLLLDAEGEISVTGGLSVMGGSDETQLRLRGGDLVWLDTAGGNLRVENGDGEATGLIDIRSHRFIAASEDALADIEGLSAAEIDARLAQNDGVVRDDGFLQAGTLQAQVDDAFLVQNSGEGEDFDQRRGFAVDVLAVEGNEGSDPLLVVNGTVGGLTGTEALAAADLTSGLDPASTFNGCLIANPASCSAVEPPPETPEFVNDARDLIEELFEPGVDDESLEGALESQLIDISQPEEFADDPLIDDPVTGAGNEDLWTGEPECEPGAEGEGLCPAGEAAESDTEDEVEPAE